ncbi:MAG: polysaccharide deacetylase family protein, partial [Oscillospiraceae bacterium]|nr:polysaccharide deacetylase family protein [Oscillospiraceae bacterium]
PEPEPETAPKILTTLMYHDFMPDGVPPTDWVITAEMFRSDLQWLKDNGDTTVLPRELAAGKLDSGEPIPDKIVMITFDDGYPSNYTIAMPLLQEYSMKAAVALIVNNFEIDSPEFLTWDQCRKMQESGCFEFGSHTYDLHIREGINGIERLDGESQDDYTLRIREDIAKSVEIIEAELGAPVTYFAYPLGKVDPWANDVLAEFFSVSVTSERAKADLSNGLYRLPRYNVTANERAAGFIE